MPDAYGSMMLVSNGLSYMNFDLEVYTYDIQAGKIANRSCIFVPFTSHLEMFDTGSR